MLWFCKFTWQPHATRKGIAQHILQQHETGQHTLNISVPGTTWQEEERDSCWSRQRRHRN
jgi:hypothetical protein